MKNNLALIVLAALAIVFGCAAEELLPKIAGVGFPILLSAVLVSSSRRDWFSLAVFAVAAGGAEDSISSLPIMTSPVYFLAVAALVRRWSPPSLALIAVYPLYQLWLSFWPSGTSEPFLVKFFVALPIGALSVWAVGRLSLWLERKAAVDEAV